MLGSPLPSNQCQHASRPCKPEQPWMNIGNTKKTKCDLIVPKQLSTWLDSKPGQAHFYLIAARIPPGLGQRVNVSRRGAGREQARSRLGCSFPAQTFDTKMTTFTHKTYMCKSRRPQINTFTFQNNKQVDLGPHFLVSTLIWDRTFW